MPQEPLNAMYAEENPYTIQPDLVDDNQRALRKVDMGAKAVIYEEPLEDLEVESFTKSVQEQDVEQVEMMQAEQLEVDKGTLESLAGSDRQDLLPRTMEQMSKRFKESDERARKAVAPFVARIYNTPGSEHLSDREVTQLAINDYRLDGYAKMLDAQGGFDYAGDILNLMVVSDTSYNAAQLADTSWFTSYEGMEALAQHRALLDPEEQLMFDKQFAEDLDEVEGSLVQKYLTTLDVMGKNPQMALEHWTDKVFLGADLLSFGAPILSKLGKLNKMRQLSKGGSDYGAAVAAEVAVREGTQAELGITKADAAMSGNPLKADMQDTVFGGTTITPSDRTRNMLDNVDKALDEIDQITDVRVFTTKEEQAEAAAKWERAMNAKDNVESASVDADGINMKMTYTTPDGEFNQFREYTLDDMGGFIEKELPLSKTATRYVWSPAFLQGKDAPLLSEAALFGTHQRDRIAHELTKTLKVVTKPIKNNKKSLQKVSNLLNKLDGKNVDANFHSLVNVGIGGTRLTEKEASSFLGIRKMFDHLYEVNNKTMRGEMKRQGLRSVDVAGETTYVRSYETAEDATKAYHFDVDNNQVMVDSDDIISSIPNVSKEDLDRYYQQGMVLVRNDSSDAYGWFKDADANHSRYALVSKDKVSGLPERVLPYTPNYVPKLRSEANFFVKRKMSMTINGSKKERQATVAWARTQQQAEAWVAKAVKGTDKSADDFPIHFDRETGSDAAATQVRMNGGLYRGSRSSSGLKYAGDNTDGDIVDALDTLQGAMQYTADRASMSELRQVARHRWYNDAAAIDPEVRNIGWSKARGTISDSDASPTVRSKLLSMHDQISNFSSIPTKSEQEMQGALRAIGKHFDAKGLDGASRWFYDASSAGAKKGIVKNVVANPVNALKGGAFHMMLGAFNPSQWWVQFTGATIAMGANPVAFTKAIPRIMAASLTDLIDDSFAHGKALEFLRNKGIITEEMIQDILMWRDSGMKESVLRASADFDNSGNFTPMSASAVRRGLSGIADKSTMFYEAGELASMRTSFFTAQAHNKALAGDKWVRSAETTQKIVARAETYRLNMSSANKAEYQRGLLALPTQFKSIFTRSLEAMFDKKFTAAEKARIAGSQIALYGATGVPIFNYWKDNIVELFASEDASSEEIQLLQKGAVGWLVSSYWDIDAEVSARTAVSGDIVGEIHDMLLSEESFLKSFAGASFTTTDRAIDAVVNTFMAGKMLWEADDMTVESVGMVAKYAGYQLAQIPTAQRRLAEAYYLSAMKQVRTSKGVTLYEASESDAQMRDVIARGLGFASEDVQDLYETNIAIYDRRDKINTVAEMYVGLMNSMTVGVDESDEEAVAAVQKTLSWLNTGIKNDTDRQEIQDRIMSLLKGKDFKGRTIDSWLNVYMSEVLGAKARVFQTGEEAIEELEEGNK